MNNKLRNMSNDKKTRVGLRPPLSNPSLIALVKVFFKLPLIA